MLPILLETFAGVQTQLMPLVIVALLIDSAIISIWYVLGSILGNAAAKASARSELYQVGGTAMLAVLIIATMAIFSSAFFNILGSYKLLNPAAVSSICQGIMANTQLTMLGPKSAIMAGSKGSTSPFPGLCNMVDPAQLQTPTTQMEYPLAVTGVIIANLTNQTVSNLDSSFVVDSFLGFLSNLQPEIRLCLATPEAEQCITPIPDPASADVYIGASFVPYAGLDFIYKSLSDYGTMLTNAYTLFVAQLTFIIVFVFLWPYLIFVGLVLRATPFTRGVGGLLIAIAIGMVFFYPLVYAIEYLSLGNGLVQSGAATYGYNYITSIPGRGATVCPGESDITTGGPLLPSCTGTDTAGCSNTIVFKPICITSSGANSGNKPTCPDLIDATTGRHTTVNPTCNYTVNFFIQPNIKDVAMKNGCYPQAFGQPIPLIEAEIADIEVLMIPFYSAISGLVALISKGLAPSSIPSFTLPFGCSPMSALATFEAMIQSFGVMGISAYLLPVLNLVITLSAILGLSGLLGGDTSLAGIAKLL